MKALDELIALKLPRLSAHLHALEADVSILATDWFLTLFAASMPSETVGSTGLQPALSVKLGAAFKAAGWLQGKDMCLAASLPCAFVPCSTRAAQAGPVLGCLHCMW